MGKDNKGNRNKNLRKDGTPKGTPHHNKYAKDSHADTEATKRQLGFTSNNRFQDTLATVQEAANKNAARKNYCTRRQIPYSSRQRPGTFMSSDYDTNW